MEFKWGEQKWEPRLDQLRDSGILYHCQGEHGSFWDVWQSSLEFQVQEGDLEDYIGLAGARGFIPTNAAGNTFSPGGELNTGGTIRAGSNPELPNGEWNLLEVITIGDRAIHYVNGVMVNALLNATWSGDILDHGQIQIQSEGAELYYRNIRIIAEDEFPAEDIATLGWDDETGGTTPETIETTGTEFCAEQAPIGSVIALRKSGGDRQWITIDSETNNLIANGDEDSRSEFLVEEHPNGCVALKSVATDLYVQVVGSSDSSAAIRAFGNAPGTWENFAWEPVGENQVGLWSEFSDIWGASKMESKQHFAFPDRKRKRNMGNA